MVAHAASGLVHGPQSPLVETKRTCARIAASDASVLLTGETGTGKEVFARFIHSASSRIGKPFVPVNCGAIPETLLESELFGYVKGAFTGAVAARRGRVSLAEGGTLFLDEVGELPLSLQVKLLRLLQERTFEPIGSSESIAANFRLIAATNRDLAEEVKAGRFRSDLYYRLHVCPIHLPALRERSNDIAHLFAHFWARRGETRPVDAAVMQCLAGYAWPGNVRELENLVERVSVCAEGDVIRMSDLPLGVRASHLGAVDTTRARDTLVPSDETPIADTSVLLALSASTGDPRPIEAVAAELRSALRPASALQPTGADGEPGDIVAGEATAHPAGGTPTPALQLPIDLPTMLRDLENAYINAALTHTGSNKKEAAKLLGMGRTTLVEKLRRRNADASRS
ncbi:MAG TPA: sigma-54 dependent transcriptional regulator [Polyangia bacterium]|nr:sigma-54 dependent transcriptional regulator [Polyangia bacterium]